MQWEIVFAKQKVRACKQARTFSEHPEKHCGHTGDHTDHREQAAAAAAVSGRGTPHTAAHGRSRGRRAMPHRGTAMHSATHRRSRPTKTRASRPSVPAGSSRSTMMSTWSRHIHYLLLPKFGLDSFIIKPSFQKGKEKIRKIPCPISTQSAK